MSEHILDIEGVEYSYGGTMLSHVPHYISSFKIPTHVKVIGIGAFYEFKGTEIIIPDSVVEIKDGAFCYCNSLESISIPGSVKEVGLHIFADCENLKVVRFEADLPIFNGSPILHCNNLKKVLDRDGQNILNCLRILKTRDVPQQSIFAYVGVD